MFNLIHLFNPENDLALGLGCRNYTPPPHAASLHRAGALLPMWWASEGDSVIAPPSLAAEAERLRGLFGLHGQLFNIDNIGAHPAPWGWSLDAKRQFLAAGVDAGSCPSDDAIDMMRSLSHRKTAAVIINHLATGGPCGIECDNPQLAVALEAKRPGCYFKSPWSGSGRGVFCASSLSPDALYKRAEGIIHRQGSVIVEPGLDKVMDFAVLFHSDGISATYKGLSVFETEPRGMYTGNIVAPQPVLADMIGAQCDIHQLQHIIKRLQSILTDIITAKGYRGWLGIDMMVYRNGNGHNTIMPCVELNLRMTMGVVAMKVARKLNIDHPHRLAWLHNTPIPRNATTLLPPAEGFALTLTQV